MRTETKLRIAVVGGGIGGLAAAAFLHRAGLGVTVYEQAEKLTEVGAGLVLSPNAVRLVRALGQFEQFREQAVQLEVGFEFRRWADGRVLSAQTFGTEVERRFGEGCFVVHRADLMDVVRCVVPESAIRLRSRCVEVRQGNDEVELIFADGTIATADVVIGADGVHSAVAGVFAASEPPRFSGWCANRCLVPAERAPAFAKRPAHTVWVGPNHHLVHYPISAGRYINVVAFGPAHDWQTESWSAEGDIDELRAEFADWDHKLTALLAAADRTGRWALLDRDPRPRWTNGPIALLGDAAHPMFPFYGQGAAQAIEDAAVLAGCLAANGADPEAALLRYERIRLPRAVRLQELSRGRAYTNHLPDGPEQEARDASFAAEDPLARSAWIYGYDAEASLADSIAE